MLSTRLHLRLGVFSCFVSCFTRIIPFYFSFLSALLVSSLFHAATGAAVSMEWAFEGGSLNLQQQFTESKGESVTVISQLHLFMCSGVCPPQTGLCATKCIPFIPEQDKSFSRGPCLLSSDYRRTLDQISSRLLRLFSLVGGIPRSPRGPGEGPLLVGWMLTMRGQVWGRESIPQIQSHRAAIPPGAAMVTSAPSLLQT